jgi:Rrf2 family nitric oxide-sensitive transcriptional repressor
MPTRKRGAPSEGTGPPDCAIEGAGRVGPRVNMHHPYILHCACHKAISKIYDFGTVREKRLRLTVYTDYSLRLLMYLALKDDGLATIAEIAESYGISKNHLMKVAHQLGVAGYVATVRGRSGGLRLAKPAEAIGLGEVVRHTEPDMALVSCFDPVNAPCVIQRCCVLQGALEKARVAFVDVLDGYTLSDLVKPRARLRALLSVAPSRVLAPAGIRSSKRAKAGR